MVELVICAWCLTLGIALGVGYRAGARASATMLSRTPELYHRLRMEAIKWERNQIRTIRR